MSDPELQEFFDFDEDDLTANRAGRLSQKQAKRIREAELLRIKILIGIGIVLILVSTDNAYAVITNAMREGFSFFAALQNEMVSIVTGIGIPGLLIGFFTWGSFRIAASRVNYPVQQVRGKASFVKVEKVFAEKRPNGSIFYQTVEVYELHVGRANFENVRGEIMNLINAGDTYAFYYAKDSKEILSAELIAKGK